MPERSRPTFGPRVSLSAALLIFLAASAHAQFSIPSFTIDGGGGTRSTGGAFSLGGTIGQPDAGLLSGSSFTLLGGFWSGGVAVTGVEEGSGTGLPTVFRVYPARPNPLADRMRVDFDLPRATSARVALYDAAGRLVRELSNGRLAAGRHSLSWDRLDRSGRPVSSGIYFLRMDAGSDRSRQKLVVLH